MEILIDLITKFVSGVGPFFLLLGLLIFVHELGHYLVAVYFGVRVETFSLGFGKKIFSYKRGETTYCLSLIPLGGYVKMYGDDPTADIPAEQKKYSFLHQPVWPRIAIVLAGPLMNLFFAILVFAIVGMLGEDVPGNQIGDIDPATAAYSAGFRSGDAITKVLDPEKNKMVSTDQWRDIKRIVENNADKAITFEVKREDSGEITTVSATPELKKNPFIFTNQREVGQIDGLSLDSVSTMIGVTDKQSPAALAGLKTFDIIESVNGETATYWRQLDRLFVKHANSGEWQIVVRAFELKNKNHATRTVKISSQSAPNKEQSLLAQLGMQRSDLFLLNIKPKSPADLAGLRAGDRVLKIDNAEVQTWQSVLEKVKSFKSSDKAIRFTVARDNEVSAIEVTPEQIELPTEQGAMQKRFAIGVVPAILSAPNSAFLQKTSNPFTAIIYGFSQSWEWSKLIAISLVRLVQNEVSARNIGGVITIGRVASQSFEVGVVAFLKMMAIISINLFLLNLLPIPVLDGGHLVFFTLEALKGSPISFKKLEIAQQVGLVLLLSLMIFALFNDITHLISSW